MGGGALPKSAHKHVLAKGEGATTHLRDGQDGDHTSATGLLGASGSLYPMALGTGSSNGPAGLVVSRAEDCSGGSPCPALPEGCVCVHRWALAAVRGGHRPSISGVCESGQGGGSVQAGGALPPAHCRPLAPRRAEAARLSAAQGSGHGLSLGFTAITRLQRKGWPGAPQTASYLSSVLGGEEEGAGAGPWQWGRGAVCVQVSPSSPARG